MWTKSVCRHALFIAVLCFIFVSYLLYRSLDERQTDNGEVGLGAMGRYRNYKNQNLKDKEMGKLIQTIRSLREKIKYNDQLIEELRRKAWGVKRVEKDAVRRAFNLLPLGSDKGNADGFSNGPSCIQQKRLNYSSSSGIQVLNVYEQLAFENLNGGAWKQGWEIAYDPAAFTRKPRLEVIVVPHSHCDPGWVKTFEQYASEQVQFILDGAVRHLMEKPDLKFIYAEMSFFENWWAQIDKRTRENVKRLLQRGQLEIVTGGWVMTDEANSHFYSIIGELFEGHEFLRNSLNPFGLSPTVAMLLQRSGFRRAVVQRVHYAVKKHLAERRQLEFQWRQLWAGDGSHTDLLTHLLPFYSYDAPHSCGPDPKVCCQFDFRRMFDAHSSCPWNIQPELVTDENIAQIAALLMDQYRKKAELFSYDVLLVPLGDDFRFDLDREWREQYANYRRLFDYMNTRKDWNIHARFGTLNDYFSLLKQRLKAKNVGEKELPILSGDFFTYADRDDHYWSGYFTSRPFYKHMDRTVQHYVRTADLLFTFSLWKQHTATARDEAAELGRQKFDANVLYNKMVEARRAHSLFQHHDGVTGTAKMHVVQDYGDKMAQAIDHCKEIILRAAEFLNAIPAASIHSLTFDEDHFSDRLPEKVVVSEESQFRSTLLLLFNSLPFRRTEVVCVRVNSTQVKVIADEGHSPSQQLEPCISVTDNDGRLQFVTGRFELCFLAELLPLSFAQYRVVRAENASEAVLRTSVEQNENAFGFLQSSVFRLDRLSPNKDPVIRNDVIEAAFDSQTGFLKRIGERFSSISENISLSFVYYGARNHRKKPPRPGDSLSGAYLFLPDGDAKPIEVSDTHPLSFLVVRGPVREYVLLTMKASQDVSLSHRVTVDRGDGGAGLFIKNTVDLSPRPDDLDHERAALSSRERRLGPQRVLTNYELVMRIQAAMFGKESFYTDLNGFQMIRRKRHEKLPLQAQVYPMASAALLEDGLKRVSLFGRQALGASNLRRGQLDVFLDRRLLQDDDLGLGQGVLDNRATESRFQLLVENIFSRKERSEEDEATTGYHSLAGHRASEALHHPPTILFLQHQSRGLNNNFTTFVNRRPKDEKTETKGKEDEILFPCDWQLVAFRSLSQPTVYAESTGASSPVRRETRPVPSAALILHRVGVECRLSRRTQRTNFDDAMCYSNKQTPTRVDLFSLFPGIGARPRSVTASDSLTLLPTAEGLDAATRNESSSSLLFTDDDLPPMDLRTFRVDF